MALTRLALMRPLVIWMILAAIAIMGIVAYFRLPLDLNPRVVIPTITVVTVYPGAGPAEVEQQVSRPLEDAVGSVAGVKDVYSSSQPDVSILSIDFEAGDNFEQALRRVREKVDSARALLPVGTDAPQVARLDINAQPALFLGLTSSSLTPEQLRALADDTIAPKLRRISGVGSIKILGGRRREIKVLAKLQSMSQYGLTPDNLVQSLRAAGRDISAGSVSNGFNQSDVRFSGAFTSLESIRHTQLLPAGLSSPMGSIPPSSTLFSPQSPPITLQDVANVQEGDAKSNTITRINGKPGVSLIVVKAPDAGSVAVADQVHDAITALRPSLPASLHIVTLRDDSRTVRSALDDVDFSLLLGALLAMFVTLLFLHNFRGTFIVSLAIPACMLATFLVMAFAGFTLNQMTLLALSLSVGILVDDSIVVLESITRHLRAGVAPLKAAFRGRAEIGFAGIAITLVDVVVFVPIAFTGGIVGGFFRQFGLCIVTATLFSLAVSFTLTPMLASRWYKADPEGVASKIHPLFAPFEKFYRLLEDGYRTGTRWALHHRGGVIAAGVAALGLTLYFTLPHLGFEFLPGTDQGQLSIEIEMPPGADLRASNAAARLVEEKLLKNPNIAGVVTTVGQVLGGFGSIPRQGPQFAQISVRLKPLPGLLERWFREKASNLRSRSDEDIASSLRAPLSQLAARIGGRITVAAVRSVIGISMPIEIQLRGPHLGPLAQFAGELRNRIEKVPGILDPDVSVRGGQPELMAKINPLRAASFSIPSSQAGLNLRYAVAGENVGTFRQDGHDLPIRISMDGLARNNVETVGEIPVGSDSQGQPVQLADIASLSLHNGPTNIERENGERLVTVTANLASGVPLGNMQRLIQKRIINVTPHSGIRVHWGGDAETLDENIIPFATSVGFAILLVYTLLVGLFNNVGTPFVIMLTLPMALTGAITALVLTGESLSLVAAIGIIMLMGLMGRNAILLLDYVNTLRNRGSGRTDAILQAVTTRLRPILMTTTATILGMLPVAMGIGQASEIRAPMAVVVIGGLLVSTPLTLIMIPVLYSLLEDITLRFRRDQIQPSQSADISEQEAALSE